MLQFGVFDLTLGEIMAWFADPWVVGWILIVTGILAASWLLENITDPIPLLGTIFDIIVKLGTILGFFVGILDILVGYVVFQTQPGGAIVAGVLILAGFALVMRVLTKFPLAFVFAIAASLFTTFTLYGLLTPYTSAAFIGEYIVQITSLKWMAIIAAVLFFFFYGLFGLMINIIALIGKIFASTPLLVIIGLAAIAVGIIVIAAPALVINPYIDPWPLPTVP
ncbi:MAG: hypothetical protein KAR33_07740 [Candidatus Thorarchaeota archaeon]|nr:hypothetical protein [Candidatus Thorarchaeota archaeon]